MSAVGGGLKRAWVSGVHGLRRALDRAGVPLDPVATDSRRVIWAKSLLAIYDSSAFIGLGVPWWTFRSADLVDAFLRGRAQARVFEWGSGASTVWLSARAASVVSVEHDPQWAASIAPVLGPNAQVRTVPAEPMVPAHARDAVASSKPGFEGLDFRAYVDAIDQDDAAYDLIVIDGRAREACLERALAHLTPGAMILFDNVDRKRYRDAIARHASDVDVVWTRGLTPALPYPTRTALLTRVR